MRLSDIRNMIKKAGIPCFLWAVPDPEDVPIPHACAAKIRSGEGFFSDDGNYYPVSVCQMYVAMYNDDEQEDIEAMIDRIFCDNDINFSFEMGYSRDEAIVVKTYTFEIPEEV